MATYNEVIEGLRILAKYDPNGLDGHSVAAEHDVLYAGRVSPGEVSGEDAKRLEGLGWHLDSETDSWARFV